MIKITILLLVALLTAQAKITRLDTFPKAIEQAKSQNQPTAVLIHGASWQPASKRLAESLWRQTSFESLLTTDAILTEIELGQQLEPEEKKKRLADLAPWERNTLTTFPALQIYGSDGTLLKTYQGRELRVLAISPKVFADHLNTTLTAAIERAKLLTALDTASPDERPALLAKLKNLPVSQSKDWLEKLKKLDPKNQSGWATELSFSNWEYLRSNTAKLREGKAEDCLRDIDQLIATKGHRPDQLALLHGARGMTLTALQRPQDAWTAYQLAYQLDPNGPNGKAILAYGYTHVGTALRNMLSPSPSIPTSKLGKNLSLQATYDIHEPDPQYDPPQNHPHLLQGEIRDLAFHTKHQAGPHIIIDLGAPHQIAALQIHNRRDGCGDRARNLTIWLSPDKQTWTQTWQATQAQSIWEILLDPTKTPPARYLKIGLPPETSSYFHLSAVNVFGH